MQKNSFIICLMVLVIGFTFMPVHSLASWVPLVPCGGCAEVNPTTEKCITPQPPCQLCHIFVLFKNILDFLFFKIIPALAILMIAIAGAHFLFSGGNPSTLAQGKEILKYTAIGLIIIYGAWVIVDTILTFTGLMKTNFEGWNPANWWKINCPITNP